MIDIIQQTPEIYSQESRDYQVLARLYTALFNFNKMYIDNMKVWNKNIDNKLAVLRAKTLNFSPRHNWDKDALEAIVVCFKYLMKNKGTLKALEYCIIILMRINNLKGDIAIDVDGNNIKIKIPVPLSSLGIVEDLFNYLIPAGYTYRIYKYTSFDVGLVSDIYNSNSFVIKQQIADWNLGIYDGDEESTTNQGYTWYRSNIIVKENSTNNVEEIK